MFAELDIFKDTLYFQDDQKWLKDLNNFSDFYIQERKKLNISELVHHSTSLIEDVNFKSFINFINESTYNILDKQGYELKDYFLATTELWVQEFSNKGFGHHNAHMHWNGHISGFYFLKCSANTSFPKFSDPRPGKIMSLLPEKKPELITNASEKINLNIKPGLFVFFNSYIIHEYTIDPGIDPFRFIHFNIRAFPKQILNYINK